MIEGWDGEFFFSILRREEGVVCGGRKWLVVWLRRIVVGSILVEG